VGIISYNLLSINSIIECRAPAGSGKTKKIQFACVCVLGGAGPCHAYQVSFLSHPIHMILNQLQIVPGGGIKHS